MNRAEVSFYAKPIEEDHNFLNHVITINYDFEETSLINHQQTIRSLYPALTKFLFFTYIIKEN